MIMYILFSVFISVGFISAFIAVRLTKKTLPGITIFFITSNMFYFIYVLIYSIFSSDTESDLSSIYLITLWIFNLFFQAVVTALFWNTIVSLPAFIWMRIFLLKKVKTNNQIYDGKT